MFRAWDYAIKKVIVLVSAVVLSGAGMLARCEQNDTKAAAEKSGSLVSNHSNFTIPSQRNPGGRELFFRMMVTVLLVAALGVGAVYISKKVVPRFAHIPAKRIKVIETVHLGPRKTIHLLKIDRQMLLIGSTNEHITKLSEIFDEPMEEDSSMSGTGDSRE